MPYMKRYLGRIPFVDGAIQGLPEGLPREHFYNRLLLSFQLGDQGTGNDYNQNSQRIAATRIEVEANGQLVVKSFSPYMKYCNNWEMYGSTALEVGQGVAADETARRMDVFVEFGLNTADVTSVLPSHLLSSLQLRITWNTLANLTNAGTLVAGLIWCDVYSLELINQGQDARAAIINKETVLQQSPSAVGFDEFDMPLGNVFRSLHIQTQGGATASGYQNDTINTVEVVQDGVVFHRRTDFLEFVSENELESSGLIDQDVAQPAGAITAMAAAASIPAGNALIMFDYQNYNAGGSSNPVAIDRALPHLPDSSKMATWKLRVNVPSVANAVTLDLLMQELIMPKVRR